MIKTQFIDFKNIFIRMNKNIYNNNKNNERKIKIENIF